MDHNLATIYPINSELVTNKQNDLPRNWLRSDDITIPLVYVYFNIYKNAYFYNFLNENKVYIGIVAPSMVYPCLVRRFICKTCFFYPFSLLSFPVVVIPSDPLCVPIFSAFNNNTSMKVMPILVYCFVESFPASWKHKGETIGSSPNNPSHFFILMQFTVTNFSAFITHVTLSQTKRSEA